MKKVILGLATLSMLSAGAAGHKFNGDINFTPMEEFAYKKSQREIILGASDCFKNTIRFHRAFHARYGMSPYYPERSRFGKLKHDDKAVELDQMGYRGMERIIAPVSCVGLALKCFNAEFKKAGLTDMWDKVRSFMAMNAVDGGAMQVALRKLGWKTYLWNPDTSVNEEWDRKEKAKDPTNKNRYWGYHAYRMHTIEKFGIYHQTPIDDSTSLVNWVSRGIRTPELIANAPLTIGIAHTGYHVFSTVFGNVIEGHSTLPITSPRVLEGGRFERTYDSYRGVYRGYPAGDFHSGVIVIPPTLEDESDDYTYDNDFGDDEFNY